MRKLWMGFAACALIISSCSQQEVFENIDQNDSRLQFSMAMGTQTRAAELTNKGLKDIAITKDDGIALYAYQYDSGWKSWYVDNLCWKNGKWNIESTRFRNEKASKYITYFPKNYVSDGENLWDATFTDTSFPQFDCIIPNVSSNQKDLVAGITDVSANQKEITLTMRHILSQVNFGVYGYNGANIEITDIEIHDVFNKATYMYRANEDDTKKPDIIGEWKDHKKITAGSAANDYSYPGTYDIVPATAVTGDKYIFGDGGNWAVGPTSTSVWYVDAAKTGNNRWNNPADIEDNPLNSLMLLPQDFKDKDAYVTFKYKIWDVGSDGEGTNAGYAAGSTDTYVEGRFKLDFENSVNPATYTSKWEQNMRYVYIIDFEKFLDDSKLDFTVDVEMYPWENYNKPGDDDGLVDVPVAGEPTNSQINGLTKNSTWYVASRTTTTVPTSDVQIVSDQTWEWSSYDFAKLEKDQSITVSFQNVLFNGKTILLELPTGYSVTVEKGVTSIDSKISGDGTEDAKIMIKNTNNEYITDNTLNTAVGALNSSTTLIYKGTVALNLTGIEPNDSGIKVKLEVRNGIIPTVGNTDNGVWTWNAGTKTATWVTR